MERSTFIPDKFISPSRETMCYKCKLILACNYYKLIISISQSTDIDNLISFKIIELCENASQLKQSTNSQTIVDQSIL